MEQSRVQRTSIVRTTCLKITTFKFVMGICSFTQKVEFLQELRSLAEISSPGSALMVARKAGVYTHVYKYYTHTSVKHSSF